MKFKKCSCCQKELKTTDVTKIGRTEIGIWVNCKSCNSTLIIPAKRKKQ